MYQTIIQAIQQLGEIGQQIIYWAWNDATIEQLIVIMIGWKMLDNLAASLLPYLEFIDSKLKKLNQKMDESIKKQRLKSPIKRLIK